MGYRMGLILLIVTGTLLGWLTTIALHIEDGREIGRYMLWGLVGSVLVGVAVSNGLVLGSVTPIALLSGLLGAAIFVAAYRYIHLRRITE